MGRVIAGGILIVAGIAFPVVAIIARAANGEPVGKVVADVLPPAFILFAVFFALPGSVLIWCGKAAVRVKQAMDALTTGRAGDEIDHVASRFGIQRAALERAIAVRRRTDEGARMKAEGAFSWSWSAACGLGIWALWHGIWGPFFLEIWSQKGTWAWIVLVAALTIPVAVIGSMPAMEVDQIMPFWCFSLLMILWLLAIAAGPIYLVVLLGRCGEMWLYIYKGVQPRMIRGQAGDVGE